MIQDWFCSTYSSIQDRNSFLMRIRLYSILRWLTRWTANFILPIVFKCHPSKACISPIRNPQLIVSLTTFPSRIDKIWLVIECIFRQTKLPDKLILWLSKEQFPSLEVLPNTLKSRLNNGLEIRLEEGDIRSHKKYLYALQEFPDADMITIDDDLFYRSTLIEEMLYQHKMHPKAIIANYTHNIKYDENGVLLPYNQWENNVLDGDHLFFGSGGGTLFPCHSLHSDVTNYNTALRLCPNADDVWLNTMARLNHTAIVHTNRKEVHLPIIQRNKISLFKSNEIGGNDSQIQQIISYCKQQYTINPFEQKQL